MRWLGIGSVLLCFAAACAPRASAPAESKADARAEPIRAVLLVQKTQPLKIALRTGVEMLAGKGLPAKAFTVIVCGEEVGSLRAGSELEPELVAAQKAGVRVAACGISLERAGVDPKTLIAAVEVVPNGLVEVLRLQREGYLSVEP